MSPPGPTYEGSLLLTLSEISDLVSHSHDPHETLTNIVGLVQHRLGTAVCSVYLLEAQRGELVLGATVGLKLESVGRVRMRLDEGLTGLVAEQLRPVMVADAFNHPRFKYFPEAGEDPYRSFLGVPLLESGELLGVLVVQTVESRTFSASEIRTLAAVAAQVATLVGDARLLERVSAAAHAPDSTPSLEPPPPLQGTSLSPGVGIGQAYVVDGFDLWRSQPAPASTPAEERRRLAAAMDRARDEIVRLSQQVSALVGEDHGAILQAQLMIMQDRTIEGDLHACLDRGQSAEAALLTTLDKYTTAFRQVATAHFQERVYDIKDVFLRLLWQLRPRPRQGEGTDRIVLVAREASVMELFAVELDRLAGVVFEHGGPQSHAAILGRSLGIPMVGQLADFDQLQQPGRRLRVDGATGVVVLDPPAEESRQADKSRRPREEETGRQGEKENEAAARAPTLSLSASLPRLEVNLNLLSEAAAAVENRAAGVGLYRSEFLFLARRTLPTEEEQVAIYRKLLQRMAGRPVTIRTFDLRPDKLAAYSQMGSAASRPFDWRLVLESPPLQQLFREQLRAILRASTAGPVRILVPLVTRTEVLDFALETLAQAREELEKGGSAFAADVPLGVMIEVAAAAPLVEMWAEHVGFFALGTNDLTASALGLDRDDPIAASQADPLHPGLLQLVHWVAKVAQTAGKLVSVCGEMAADPHGAIALAALGVDSLSVAVAQLDTVRSTLSAIDPERLPQLAGQLLRQRTAGDARRLLEDWSRSCRATRGARG